MAFWAGAGAAIGGAIAGSAASRVFGRKPQDQKWNKSDYNLARDHTIELEEWNRGQYEEYREGDAEFNREQVGKDYDMQTSKLKQRFPSATDQELLGVSGFGNNSGGSDQSTQMAAEQMKNRTALAQEEVRGRNAARVASIQANASIESSRISACLLYTSPSPRDS